MIEIKKHSGIYTLTTEQILNIPLKKAWDFFSSPENLQKITPFHMGFEITSNTDSKAYSGQIVTYRVGIIPSVKQNWVTEITHVEQQKYFIDEQRFGPYKMWHHEHFFETLSNEKTRIKDKISYKIPFGIFGSLAQDIFIKKQLITIFEHRRITLEKLFNER